MLSLTVKYDLACTGACNGLDPVYLRGEACLQLREGCLAADEFEISLHHPEFVGLDPEGRPAAYIEPYPGMAGLRPRPQSASNRW